VHYSCFASIYDLFTDSPPYRRKRREAYNTLSENHKGRSSISRLRSKWEDNIKTELEEIRLRRVEWAYLTQDTNSRGSSELNELSGSITAKNFSNK
jgi:hypothetical protein